MYAENLLTLLINQSRYIGHVTAAERETCQQQMLLYRHQNCDLHLLSEVKSSKTSDIPKILCVCDSGLVISLQYTYKHTAHISVQFTV